MKNYLFRGLMILFIPFSQSQTDLPDDYLSKDFHKGRREAFRALMPENSVAAVFLIQREFFQRCQLLLSSQPGPVLFDRI